MSNNHPRLILSSIKNIKLDKLDVFTNISILYYPYKINKYRKEGVYPKIRSDGKLQIDLYLNTLCYMYRYNSESKLLLLKEQDWNYLVGYYLDNENRILEIENINQLYIENE